MQNILKNSSLEFDTLLTVTFLGLALLASIL